MDGRVCARGARWLPLIGWLAVFTVAAAFPAAADAPPARPSGTLRVTVLERTGPRATGPLPGATIAVTGDGVSLSLVAGPDGLAVFRDVPASGTLSLSVALPGYSGYRRTGVRVAAGQETRVTVTLVPERVEQVVVGAKERPIAMQNETQGRTTISAEAFDDLPVFGRDYQNVLTFAPGVQDTNGDGNPNVHGARETDFKLLVDGVSNANPLTGKFLSFLNPDAIEEIEVIDAGADASFGGVVGGFAKVSSKSGTNRFEGALHLYARDSAFDQQATVNEVRYHRIQPSLFFAGPILRDRLWFSMSHEWIDQGRPQESGTGSYVETLKMWRHADKLTWQLNARDRLMLQYTADPRDTGPLLASDPTLVPRTALDSGYRLVEGGPTAMLRWTSAVSARGLFDVTVAFSRTRHDESATNPGALNRCVSADPDVNPFPYLAGYLCTDDTTTGLRSGAYNRGTVERNERWTTALSAEHFVDRWLGGSHHVKFGVGVERARYTRTETDTPQLRMRLLPYADGALGDLPTDPYLITATSYYFPQRTPDFSLIQNRLRPQTGDDTSLGRYWNAYVSDTYQPWPNLSITVGVRFQREELRSDGYVTLDPSAERAGYDDAVRQCGENFCGRVCDPAQGATMEGQCSLCLRNCTNRLLGGAFTLHPLDNPDLVNLGGGDVLDCEFAINPIFCGRLEAYLQSTGKKPRIRDAQTFQIANNALAPRFAVSWDPGADGRTRVFGSWGRYYGDTVLAPLVLENGPDSVISEFTANIDRAPSNRLNAGAPESIVGSGLSVHMVDRDLKMQHSDEWVAGIEREIAPETTLGVRWVRREYRDQLQDRDINHRPITDEEMKNRPYGVYPLRGDCPKVDGFWDCSGLVLWKRLGSPDPDLPTVGAWPDGLPDLELVNPFFNAIYQVGNYNSTDYRAAVLELKRRWYQGWEGSLSYTWSRALGDAEEFDSSLGNDATATDHERGLLSFDQTHVVKLSGRVHVPRWGGVRLGGVLTYQSGLPYSIFEEREVLDFPTDLNDGLTVYYNRLVREYGYRWALEPASMDFLGLRTIYPTGQRNDQRGPGWWTLDLDAQKEFRTGGATTTVLELSVFNALNDDTRRVLGERRTLLGRNGTGELVYTSQKIFGVKNARQFQLALKLAF